MTIESMVDANIEPDADLRPQCANEMDDDHDGVTDVFDPGCESSADLDESDPELPPVCSDDIDNDDDGLTDFPADPDCLAAGAGDEGTVCGADVSVSTLGQDGGRVRMVLDTSGPATRGTCGEGVGRGAVLQITLTEPSSFRVDVDGGPSPGALVLQGRTRCRVPATTFACVEGDRTLSMESPVLPPGTYFLHLQWAGEGFSGDPVELSVVVSSILRACNDGLDNDEDGLTDLADPGCLGHGDDDEINPVEVPECADGLDNDGDGDVDWPLDVDCTAAGTSPERGTCLPTAQSAVATTGLGRFRFRLENGPQSSTQGRCGGLGQEALVILSVEVPSRLVIDVNTARQGTVVAYLRAQCGVAASEVACNAAFTDHTFTIDRAEPGRYFLILDRDAPFVAEAIDVEVETRLEPLELAACEDARDNDQDGLVDRADPGCASPLDDDEADGPTPPACADGADNDEDGETDWPDDPHCHHAGGVLESPGCGDIPLVGVPEGGGRFRFAPNVLSPGIARAACRGDLGGEVIFALHIPSPSTLSVRLEDGASHSGSRLFLRTACLEGETEFACGEDQISLRRVEPGPVFVFAEVGRRHADGPLPTLVIEAIPLVRACNDLVDNDDDGRIDLADPGCTDSLGLDEEDPPDPPECADGVDNDDDGAVDWPDDGDCGAAGDTSEAQPVCPGIEHLLELVDRGGRFQVDLMGRPDLYQGQCGGRTGEAVVRLVLTQRALVTVETHGDGFDTVLYARGNCGPDEEGELGCDDDGGEGLQSRLALDLFPGTWFFFVDGFGGEGGQTEVQVDVVPRGEQP